MTRRRSLSLPVLLACVWTPIFAATIKLPSPTRTGPAADVVVPIVVDPGSGVTSITASFAFDDSALEPLAVYRTVATDDWDLAADLAVPGVVSLTLDGGSPLGSGATEVAWVLFDVLAPAPSVSSLSWLAAELDSGATAVVLQNGSVQVVSAQRVVAVPDGLQGVPGTPLMIPITASDAGGADAIDLVLRYNTAVLDAVDVTRTPLTQTMQLADFLGIPGEVRIALWSVQPLPPGGGALVQVTFETVGGFGDATPLDLTKGVFNEGAITTALDDGLIELCDPVDGDVDGFSGCAGDCDNADPEVSPQGMESCDAIDNDCNGSVDDGVPAPEDLPGLVLDFAGGNVLLEWTAVAEATSYDLLRGELGALRSSDGDFVGAVEDCIADDLPVTSFEDGSADGASLWYLVRASNCGGDGTYDSGSPGQAESRDEEIAAAGDACP